MSVPFPMPRPSLDFSFTASPRRLVSRWLELELLLVFILMRH